MTIYIPPLSKLPNVDRIKSFRRLNIERADSCCGVDLLLMKINQGIVYSGSRVLNLLIKRFVEKPCIPKSSVLDVKIQGSLSYVSLTY